MAYTDSQCELVELARQRQIRDLRELPKEGYYFDETAASRVCSFFEKNLYHSKGEWAGQLFKLEDWQSIDILRPVFGWMRPNGFRRFRVVYIELPRKNGKSTIFAGLGNYLFIADKEPGAEIYTAATKEEQAKIIHKEAERMVRRSPALSNIVTVYRKYMEIKETDSTFYPLGADSTTLDGLNTHGALIDELHAHKKRELYDVILTSTGARRQAMMASITTAGFDRNSICYELREYSEKLLRGIIKDESFFCYIATIDEGDDWTDPKSWAKANPNLDISIKQDYLENQLKKAIESNAFENTFKRLHLNIWTEQDVRWLSMAAWDECGEPFDIEELEGRECFAGLDLSSTTDITAAALVFPFEDGTLKTLFKFWIPDENMRQRAHRDRVPYVDWANQGLINATPGNVIDYDRVREDFKSLGEMYDIREIAIDRWNATQLMTQLDGDGFTVVPFGQGYASMSAPTKELEAAILSKKLQHGGNKVARWMASNVAVEMDAAGNIKPSKKVSIERIDGMVALIMAFGRYSVYKDDLYSVYSDRGLITF